MNIIEPQIFRRGKFMVILRPALDHTCPLYRVYLGNVLIGKSISIPDEDACKWLELQQREQTFYAYSRTPLPELSKNGNGTRRSVGDARRAAEARAARTRRVGAPRKAVEKALAGG